MFWRGVVVQITVVNLLRASVTSFQFTVFKDCFLEIRKTKVFRTMRNAAYFRPASLRLCISSEYTSSNSIPFASGQPTKDGKGG